MRSWFVVLAGAWVAAAGCDPAPASELPPAVASPPPPSPFAPSSGAVALAAGGALYVTDASDRVLWWVARPDAPDAAAQRVELPGRPVHVLATDTHVLVTTRAPSALLVCRAHPEAGLSEVRAVALPDGAWGVSAAAGVALVTSSAAGQISLVDVEAATLRWSRPVGALPRSAVLSADGREALVTHLGAGYLSRIALDLDAHVDAQGVRVERLAFPAGAGLAATAAPDAQGASVLVTHVSAAGRDGEAGHVGLLRFLPGAFALTRVDDEARPATEVCADPRGEARRDGGSTFVACTDSVAVVGDGGTATKRINLGGPRVRKPDCREADDGRPIGPRHLFRYGDATWVENLVERYACRYPDRVRLIEIARSHQDRPVTAMLIGDGVQLDDDRPAMMLNGGHHGSELYAPTMALDAVAALLEDDSERMRRMGREAVVTVVPLVNPDGNVSSMRGHAGRKNGRDRDRGGKEGVDLNRNYPFRWGTLGERGSSSKPDKSWYRGPGPGSEPETQGMMWLARRERFVASASFHTGTLAICPPYTIPGVENPEPNVAWDVAADIVRRLPPHPEGGWELRRNLYELDGNDQDWHRHEHGTLAILVEGIRKPKEIAGKDLPGAMTSIRATWTLLVDRFLDGPAVQGRVTDALGRPVEAQVEVAEITYREGERWTTRCRDGRFDRYLPAPGRYTLRVRAPGLEIPVDHAVEVRGREQVTIVLPALREGPAACFEGARLVPLR